MLGARRRAQPGLGPAALKDQTGEYSTGGIGEYSAGGDTGQQAGLNNMTVQEYLDGRQAFEQRKLKTGSGRGSGRPATDARDAYAIQLESELEERFRRAGKSQMEATELAAQEASKRMTTLAAIHDPDMVAGGANMIAGMGDRHVNSTIGGQWKSPIKTRPDEPTRIGQIDAAANAVPAGKRATTRMNIRLERCR